MATTQLEKNSRNKIKAAIEALEAIGAAEANILSVEAQIRTHPETWSVMPDKSTYAQQAQLYMLAAQEEKEQFAFSRNFYYKPWDGANAVAMALSKAFGYPGFAKATESMFGKQPPRRITVPCGPNQTIEVPWGELQVPDLEAVFTLGATNHDDYGMIFVLNVVAAKKKQKAITGFFAMVEQVLQENSIYNGQALVGHEMPEFFGLDDVRRDKVIYRRDVGIQLETELFLPTLLPHLFRNERQVVLLQGTFGGGKTTTLRLVALYATMAGATFIMGRAGKDKFGDMLQFANLMSRGDRKVFLVYEDLDVLGDPDKTGQDKLAKLLDEVDGILSKNSQVSLLFTTNHPKSLYQGLIRRMTSFVELAEFDPEALGRLVMSLIPSNRLGEVVNYGSLDTSEPHTVGDELTGKIDFDIIASACAGFSPVHVSKVTKDAEKYAIARQIRNKAEQGGVSLDVLQTPAELQQLVKVLPYQSIQDISYILDTQDFVIAAKATAIQFNLQQLAKTHNDIPEFEKSFGEMIAKKVTEVIDTTWMAYDDAEDQTRLVRRP